MKYSILSKTNQIRVTLDIEPDTLVKKLIGYKYDKKTRVCTCDYCFINCTVLGIPVHNSYITDFSKLDDDRRLYLYQKRDIQKMLFMNNCLNANKMGYGKTIEAIKAFRAAVFTQILIVAPKSVLLQWKSQIEEWAPEYEGRIYIIDGSKESLKQLAYREPGIYITNYEKVRLNSIYGHLKSIHWQLIIADEAHRIKNHKAKRSEALCSLPAQHRWALTGTPILNKPDDLYGILKFVDPFIVGKSYWNFLFYFCKIEQGPFGFVNKGLVEDPYKQAMLSNIMDNYVIRNPQLQLTPGKDTEIVKLKMNPKQKKLYSRVANLIIDELPEDLTIPNGAVMCLRLQQVTSCPVPWEDDLYGAKFEYIKDLLEDNPDEKFVVFSVFATTCGFLEKYLGKECTTYTGKLNAEEKYVNKKRFIEDPSCRVIAGTIGAMGEGVDGLQKVCNNVIFIDRDWSPEILQQCEDRLNRIGQTQRVHIRYLECVGTYDRHVGRVTLKKSDDIRRILRDEDEDN